MCDKCDFKYYYNFDSETIWKEFDEIFIKSHINELDSIEKNVVFKSSISSHDKYVCKHCGQEWAYSYPENAWRGFFLPEAKAIEYQKKLKKDDKFKGYLGLTILIIVIILIIRSCAN